MPTNDKLKKCLDGDITEDLTHSTKLLDIRERMQYSTKTSLAQEKFQSLKNRTKQLLDKIRREIEQTKD